MNDRIELRDLGRRAGAVLGVSSWIALEQHRIDQFADCTEDHQWIHVDPVRAAKETPFGGTIAHGYLTLALIAPTIFEVLLAHVRAKQVVNSGLDKVRFVAPVRAGKRVRNHIKLVSVEGKGDGRYLVSTENTFEIEGEEKPALVAIALAMFFA